MILCQACIADTSVTLYAVQSLDKDEPTTYTLIFHDLPTGTKEELVYQGENDAIYAFAAWLVADEVDIGILQGYLDYLRSKLKTKNKFLP